MSATIGTLRRLRDLVEVRRSLPPSGQETRMMSAPGILAAADLVDRRARVLGRRVGHRLHGDRRIAADGHVADHDLAGLAALDIAPGAD